MPSESQTNEMRERYRRLIPYMTYYVLSNYIGAREPPSALAQPSSVQVHPNGPAAIHRGPYTVAGKPRYRAPPAKPPQEERFVPSVQYDPKDVGQDADYFVPLGLRPKETYEDYQATSRPAQKPVTVPEVRYHTTPRPVTFVPQKPKSLLTKLQQDYVYGSLLGSPEEFESVRFATKSPPARYLQPMTARPAPLEPIQPPSPRVSLNNVLKSLQLTNQLPEILNRDNIDSSIKTLMEILNILNMSKKESYVPVYEKYKPIYTKPKVITESNYEATQIAMTPHNDLLELKPAGPYIHHTRTQLPNPHEEVIDIKPEEPYINKVKETSGPPQNINKIIQYYVPIVQDIDVQKTPHSTSTQPPLLKNTEEPIEINYHPEQNNEEILEDEKYTLQMTTEEPVRKTPTHLHSISPQLKYGATRGKPHVDYPAYTEIPETNFSCKQQRYKGFFGDPQTGCQVWHYCDLNGGKSSFLCPNGTIFSQVALTCDWWFNVKCESTTQLYVLNERLYKYILPIMPKFPEDFTGPEVDKYLELKFKEMEAKMKEKKVRKEQEEKGKSTVNTLQSIEDSK